MSDEDERVQNEAAAWLARLNSRSVSTETVEAFFAWRRDPDNGRAFARLDYLWDRSAALAGDTDIAHAVQEALTHPIKAPAPRIGRRMMLAGATAAALGVGLASWWWRDPHYATQIGEQRTITLEDGSRIELNTDSAVRVSLTPERRTVWLERGEAWFAVAHDPRRPFTVHGGRVAITALGTAFVVHRLDARDRVVLAEGRVDVRSATRAERVLLTPGATVDAVDGRLGSPRPTDLDRELAWRTGRLILDGTRLADAVTEMNRYSHRTIRLEAPVLATVPVSGTFEIGDVAAFVDAVTALFPITATPGSDGGVILRPRR